MSLNLLDDTMFGYELQNQAIVLKMVSRYQMGNDLLPQGRLSQAVPLRTHPGPPSVSSQSVSKQPNSVQVGHHLE